MTVGETITHCKAFGLELGTAYRGMKFTVLRLISVLNSRRCAEGVFVSSTDSMRRYLVDTRLKSSYHDASSQIDKALGTSEFAPESTRSVAICSQQFSPRVENRFRPHS